MKILNKQKVRNFVACNPLLGKSCVHMKSRKAERKADAQSLIRARKSGFSQY